MTPNASARILILICASVLALPQVHAAPKPLTVEPRPSYRGEESQIPTKPSAPTPLQGGTPSDTFRCTRYFTWKGKQLECDSYVRLDAEKLRTIVNDVPESVSDANKYQQSRARLRGAAYVGSAGLLLSIFGLVMHQRYSDIAPAGQNITTGIQFIGLGLAAGSLIYGLGVIQSNEERLGTAVQFYNTKHPDTPIELKFTTGFDL